MAAHFIRSAPALFLAGLAAGLAGCATRTAATPQPLTDAERAAIVDTVRQLYRESSQTFDSDLDCEQIIGRLRAGEVLAYYVAQGRMIERGTREEGVQSCRARKRDRLSAEEDIQEQRVEVLGRDAAIVATRSVYTIRYRDGRTTVRPQVVTTVWSRGPDGWRRAHFHLSWQVGGSRDRCRRAGRSAVAGCRRATRWSRGRQRRE